MTRRALFFVITVWLMLFSSSRLHAQVTLVWSTGLSEGCQGGPVMEVLPGQRLHSFYRVVIVGTTEYFFFYNASDGSLLGSWLIEPVGPTSCNPLRIWRVGDVNGSGHDDFVVELNRETVAIADLVDGPGALILSWDSPGHAIKYEVANLGLDATSNNIKLTILETDPDPSGPVMKKQQLINYDLNVMPAAVEPGPPDGPARLMLAQNRPNPFRGTTRIPYSLSGPAPVQLRIFDVAGRVIRTLRAAGEAGAGEFLWDGRDDGGQPVRSGMLLYELEVDGRTQGKKMIVLR